jgi:hypothetical protein
MTFSRRTGLLIVVVLALVLGATPAFAGSSWPVYHGNAQRTGNDTSEPSLNPLHQAWAAPLDGNVYAQPVVFAGRVYAATENDTIFALDAHNGRVLWARHVGNPVTNVVAQVGCGNIDPLGITSTPVIDTASHTIYVVAAIEDGFRNIHHQLVALDALTGALRVSVNVDPGPPQNPLIVQQRAGLALGNGRIYIGYGGYDGDCGDYHGWLVSVTEAGTGKIAFDATPHTGLGAMWNTGGPSIDPAGNVFMPTGNPDPVVANHDYGESVIKFDANLNVTGVLPTFPGGDRDLGSVGTAILPNNLAFQIGKQQTGILFDRTNMAVVQQMQVCSGEAFGSTAFDGSHLFVPCSSHIQQVNINSAGRSMSLGWTGPPTRNAGPPILAGGILWSVDYGTGTLYGLNPANGGTIMTVALGAVPHFTSPSAALGLLLIGTNSGVTAMVGPSGPPPPAPSACTRPTDHTSYWIAARDGNVFPFGGAPNCGSLFGVPLVRPIVGMAPVTGGRGYDLVASDGGVFTFGDARFFGSTGGLPLVAPVVGIAPTVGSHGYWLDASDGGVFSFGNAQFHGSMGGRHLDAPVVGMAATPGGHGYWLVASDGGVFSFGDARFFGSMGGRHLNQPVVGMAATPSGHGYWLVASDGGIFAFGDAKFYGSTGALALVQPVVGMSLAPGGAGYRLVASDGGLFSFGAPFHGSATQFTSAVPAVAMADD